MDQEAIINFMEWIEAIGYFIIFYFFVTKRVETEDVFARIGDEVAERINKIFKKEG